MKTNEVFGIQPEVSEHAYIDRGSLDREFRRLVDREQTHIAIRGASKAGKSWLRQRVLAEPIVVQCRITYSPVDIYRDALARLDVRLQVEQQSQTKFTGKVTATGEAGVKLLLKATGQLEAGIEHASSEKTVAVGKDHADLEFVASLIRASGRTLVIEDFHYLTVDQQTAFAFDLKTLWDYKTMVVIVGVWSSQNMLIALNPDLSGRIDELSVIWQPAELKQVFVKGCRALGLRPTDAVANHLAAIAYESAGLLQKLALRYLDELGIENGMPEGNEQVLNDRDALDHAAMHVADQLNQVYQTFARRVSDGIRSRTRATGIYAHAMAAIMGSSDEDLSTGLSVKTIHTIAHARQPRILIGNLKAVLSKFPGLQVDDQGRGLVLAYDPEEEIVSVVDKQLFLYRKYATVRWPWEQIIEEAAEQDAAYDAPAA
ncbi:hypothetical protein L2Y96_13740 [Luteibacter aegosomaticola]|jgi:hypothetical protein|uniref:hypothetical protein n=1 Tax=Luteibacter aegosomaticola TaxID=2911538 RepID=UPI001FFAED1E|nr:hypothetical protein [Luteibacter aegosomaticola]UPG88480.1 hypothetical protein L2Y96_13740 [Luteibacter aegosomaticola]